MQKSDAIQYFGSAPKLARALGLTRQAIYQWPDTVPDLYQYKLAAITDGALRVSSLPAGSASDGPSPS